MDHGDSEFWGYEKIGSCYVVIDGGQKISFLRLELVLDGYSIYFRTEK